MINALIQFKENIQRVRDLSHLVNAIGSMTTSAIDLSDLLRSQIVLSVSALDHFIHEYVRLGMIEIQQGARVPTDAYLRFQIPLRITHPTGVISSSDLLDDIIREKHSWLSFQHPDKIADAIRLISSEQLWQRVGDELGIPARDIKIRLSLIVDRRNKIAHEADMDPTNPGIRWPINSNIVNDTVDFIEKIAQTIFNITI